jgi:hypothetical protein
MPVAIVVQVDIATIDCASCAVTFGLPERMLKARRDDGAIFYCPSGHQNVFRKTLADRLRADLATTQARLTAAHRRADGEAERRKAAERSTSALKGQMTRLRTRAANGVCPCCSRSFTNLRRHMASKHPDFTAGPLDDATPGGGS